MSTIPISLVPVAFTCAVLSGLFVLSQVFHPWVSWSRYTCGLVYSFIYFGAIVALAIWYWLQRPFSELAIRLLLEICWLNGLGGQVYRLFKISPQGIRIQITLAISTVAAIIQVLGFGLSQCSESRCHGAEQRAVALVSNGACLFQVAAAFGAFLLCKHSNGWNGKGFIFMAIFSLAALGNLLLTIFYDKSMYLLASNVLQCVVSLFLVLLQVHNRFFPKLQSINEEPPKRDLDPPFKDNFHTVPSQSSTSTLDQSQPTIDDTPIKGIRAILDIKKSDTGVTAEVLVTLEGNLIQLRMMSWRTLQNLDDVKNLVTGEAYNIATRLSNTTGGEGRVIFSKASLQEVIYSPVVCQALSRGEAVRLAEA